MEIDANLDFLQLLAVTVPLDSDSNMNQRGTSLPQGKLHKLHTSNL